jgi:acetylornithine deacetylase/succinyl-diaminopimelate desuccinylase-like protein
VLEGSQSTNIAPAEARAHLDARLLPGETCGGFTERMAGRIDDPGVEISTLLAFEAGASPVGTPLFAAIERVARRRDPAAVVVPRVIAGFTDAHWFREAGVVSYGFVPRRLRPVDTRGIHGPNERISLDNLELGIEITIEILTELAGATRADGPTPAGDGAGAPAPAR